MTDMNLAAAVRQEELLDISIERVEKLNSPLLVIGLGGTGADVVRTVKRCFADRYVLPRDGHGNAIPVPPRTAYLAIDTDKKSHDGFGDSEFADISLEGIAQILDPKNRNFNLNDFERKWVNKGLNSASHGLGAGTYRQAARFMLSRNFGLVYNAIRGALQNIVTVSAGDGAGSGRTEIVVATGICGGTGSGTFLDIAQIVRHCMAREANLAGKTYKITGYIVMPDVSLQPVQGNPALESVLKQNGFAALKELDFWMRVGEHKTPYAMQYAGSSPIAWQMPPFDSCILMSAIGVNGEAYADGYKVIQRTIAENLLHYLAHEQTEKKADGTVEYTYISYEDNLKATVTAMEKRLPVFYGYRAVGAYTKRIPKKKLLYYEGSLLFDTFVPPRDPQGRLVANPSLLRDGKSATRARDIAGGIATLYTNFCADVKLPTLCNVQPNEKDKMERLRALQPLPHDRADSKPNPWLTSVIQPAALAAAGACLDAAWKRFADFAAQVIGDPALGPFSLMDYLLDKEKGLLPALNEELRGWEANSGNFRNNVGRRYEDCRNTWKSFLKPPMLGGKKAEEGYLKALVDYYDSVRKNAFMEEHAEALRKLVRRIGDYLDHALKPLCGDLEALQREFGQAEAAGEAKIESDIFTLDAVKGRIDADFRDGNTDGKVTVDFLSKLCGTGLSFIYRVDGKNNTLEKMRQSLDSCFGAINGQSLDSIMEQTVGNDPLRQQEFIDSLGKSVIESAQPLFAQNKAYAAEPQAEFNYLSVPDNAQAHIARYKETLKGKNTTPKGSSLRDHMYCTAAWDGLPLYRYNLMNDLESVYAANLHTPSVSMGLHLVWDGDLDSEYTTNWTRLPSPCPHYFFESKGRAYAEKAYAEVRELAERARRCGMLDVDASMPVPVFRLHFFYTDAKRQTVTAAETIIREVDAISVQIDPRTGERIAPEALKAKLEKYLSGAVAEALPCDKQPAVMAPALGLQSEACDPWDETVAANPKDLAAARRNHVTLSNEMASAVVAAHPRILLALKHQVEGFEHAKQILADIEKKTQAWDPRIAYADKVAQMLIHAVLVPSIDGWRYTSETGEKHPVIQASLLSADIQKEPGLVQTAAYLGDLAADNLVRRELENQVDNRKAELRERGNDGRLTKEEVQSLLQNIERVGGILTKEINAHKDSQKKVGADKQKEEKALAMLGGMKAVAETEANNLKNMLTFMPDEDRRPGSP